MFNKLLQTENDARSFIMRVLLGIVFFPHGAQKVFGWFGGGKWFVDRAISKKS